VEFPGLIYMRCLPPCHCSGPVVHDLLHQSADPRGYKI
jgi:hypothetical protein